MSYPENPLARYRSYSYHHILIACDTTACANALDEQNADPNATDHGEAFMRSGDEAPKSLEEKLEVKTIAGAGSYVILIDGRVDTDYVIRNVSWSAMVAANVVANDQYSSIIYEGKMTIEEPRGVQFFNMMNLASQLLNVEPAGMTLVLKTIFVGHIDELGNDSIVMSETHPLHMVMYDLKGTFDVTGGVYVLEFTTIKNGAADLPIYNTVSQEVSVNLSKNNTLNEAVNLITAELNKRENITYQCATEQHPNKDLKRKEFIIQLEPPYNDARYKIKGFKVEGTDRGQAEEGGVFTVGISSTIRSFIHKLMSYCDEITKDSKENKFPSIRTNVTKEEDREIVEFVIFQKEEVTNDEERQRSIEEILYGEAGAGSTDELIDKIMKNLIVFNYMYTGLNTDIINCDLKMEMGLAFLTLLKNADGIMTPEEEQVKGVARQEQTTVSKGISRNRVKQIVGSTIKTSNTENSDVQDPVGLTRYQAAFHQFIGLENAGTAMVIKIHGNPFLMNSVNTAAGGSNVTSNSDTMGDWPVHPGLAIVNINMPNDETTDVNSYTQPFWYRGLYKILQIDTLFDSGTFTQDLHLLAVPSKIDLLDGEPGNVSCSQTPDRQPTNSPTAHVDHSSRSRPVPVTAQDVESAANDPNNATAERANVGANSAAVDTQATMMTQALNEQGKRDPNRQHVTADALASGDLSVGIGATGVRPDTVMQLINEGNVPMISMVNQTIGPLPLTDPANQAILQRALADNDAFNVFACKAVIADFYTKASNNLGYNADPSVIMDLTLSGFESGAIQW